MNHQMKEMMILNMKSMLVSLGMMILKYQQKVILVLNLRNNTPLQEPTENLESIVEDLEQEPDELTFTDQV